MNSVDFNKLKEEFILNEDALLGIKKTQYASDQDRLINFKEASEMVGLTPEHYCFVLMGKHIHSIKRAVATGGYTWCWTTDEGEEGLKQRISDARNYLLLLAGLLEERDIEKRHSTS